MDDPLKQTRSSMKFSCISETLERLPELLKRDDFGFLGIVHTHPSGESRLSLKDAAITLGVAVPFVRVSGIYNGDRLEFYTFEDPRVSMPLQIR